MNFCIQAASAGRVGLGGWGTDLEFVSNNSLSDCQIIEVIVDILVSTEVWNWVVDFVASLLLFVLVLHSSRRKPLHALLSTF